MSKKQEVLDELDVYLTDAFLEKKNLKINIIRYVSKLIDLMVNNIPVPPDCKVNKNIKNFISKEICENWEKCSFQFSCNDSEILRQLSIDFQQWKKSWWK